MMEESYKEPNLELYPSSNPASSSLGSENEEKGKGGIYFANQPEKIQGWPVLC